MSTEKSPESSTESTTTSTTIHPVLSDEKFFALLTVAAAEVIGDAVTVVRFRPMSCLDWSWSQLGRTDLHSSHRT